VLKSNRLRWAWNIARIKESDSVFKASTCNWERDLYEGLGVDARTVLE
jgi:hypothetical protein